MAVLALGLALIMKVGDTFDLPENVTRIVGTRGKIKNPDETKTIGMYEVVLIENEFKGKIIVTYGHKRCTAPISVAKIKA